MTHNESRTFWWKEGLISLGVGVLYGTTSVAVGHPFDTIKTKMQAQRGFETPNMIQSFRVTLQTQGILGLYRGSIPPMLGSGVYRSAQFGIFESIYTYLGRHAFLSTDIPYTGGFQLRVLMAGIAGSTARAIIETPLEYIKVRKQIGESWRFNKLYSGFGVTWIRTMGLMNTYFIIIDYSRRKGKFLFEIPVFGPFLVSGCAATFAWWIVWPFEYMKSQVQGEYGHRMPLFKRMKLVIESRGGFFALYRGLGPGTIRSFIANGASMSVMQYAQKKVSEYGLRD